MSKVRDKEIAVVSIFVRRDWVVLYFAVVQNRITAFWFRGKELALAFGLTLAFSRLGSVLNFFLTQRFEAHFGMQWTLWGGEKQQKPAVYTICY